jgi:hypothetical protein
MLEWRDAAGSANWRSQKSAQGEPLAENVTSGWLVKRGRKKWVIAASVNRGNHDVSDVTVIPRANVVSVRSLTPGKRRKP